MAGVAPAAHEQRAGREQRESQASHRQSENDGIPSRALRNLIALADDVSGAAETAVALMSGDVTACVALRPEVCGQHADVRVLDLDSRGCEPGEAARRVRSAAGDAPVVFKKIDSLLRGNLEAEVAALPRPLVVAPALPALGRTVVGGVVHVDGVPLAQTDHWRVEPGEPPASIRALLGDVPVFDARTDADLDAIAARALALGRVSLVGSAGLAAALGRRLGSKPLAPLPAPSGADVLVIVGTAAPFAAEQVARLGAPDGVSVLTADGPGRLGRLAQAAVEAGHIDLVLTGGETARAVLDALGIAELRPLGQIHHGAVLSRAPDGRTVVTRPGGFGGPDSLLEIVRTLRGRPA